MKLFIESLYVVFKKEEVELRFADYNYIYGKIGAGKSSILRLIDFCLGGDSEHLMTPAFQQEFVKASLKLRIEKQEILLTRNEGASDIAAEWSADDTSYAVLVPAKTPSGEVLEGTGIEVISDLIFYFAGVTPPKVRRSKIKVETQLIRLSLRQLMWYCYLDQENIDSSFFNLDSDANPYKRLNSKDVLRFIVGIHQERVAELESELTSLYDDRRAAEESAESLKKVLGEVNIGTEIEIQSRKEQEQERLQRVTSKIEEVRKGQQQSIEHAVEGLRSPARVLGNEIEGVVGALAKVDEILEGNIRFRNELRSLRARMERTVVAMDVLSGLDFESCPRCGRKLPQRVERYCLLCGQQEKEESHRAINKDAAIVDIDERVKEIDNVINERTEQRERLKRELSELREEKQRLDREINLALERYDSAFLSSVLEFEREQATIQERTRYLDRMLDLRNRVNLLQDKASSLETKERNLRKELKEERKKAEKDTTNIDRLKILFLDSLLRAKIPGFSPADSVEITAPHYLPEVLPHEGGELATSSFSNLGSGGKKTLFKCCFAVAIHRLAKEIGAQIPTLLMLDSPMKNISERENRDQFAAFHKMLLELSVKELANTQIFVVDKELFETPEDYSRSTFVRHMDPSSDKDPPLVPYYRGP